MFKRSTIKVKNLFKPVMASALALVLALSCVAPVDAAEKEVPITSVSLPSTVSVNIGESKTLTVRTTPGNTTYTTNIEWGRQPNGHFTAKANGFGTYWKQESSETVTGVSAGKGYLFTTVKVFDSNGQLMERYKLNTTVIVAPKETAPGQGDNGNQQPAEGDKNIPLKKITLDKEKATKKVGETFKLTVSYDPGNTTDSKKVTWTTSNKTVASVSSGNVSCHKAGSAVITAKVGSKTAKCTVTVKDSVSYIDVPDAYTELNKFRTKKKVWQWNKDNKTKKYFNTNSKNTLKKLKKDTDLEKTAKIRAKEIAKKFSHTRPNGESCFTVYPSKYTYRGENIAAGQDTAIEVTKDWMETDCDYSGQGHRRAMLNNKYTHVGIACFEINGCRYWVQAFGGK